MFTRKKQHIFVQVILCLFFVPWVCFAIQENVTESFIKDIQEKLDSLQNHLMLFFTGFPRNASEIAGEVIRNVPSRRNELKTMTQMVGEAINVLNGDKDRLTEFGRLLHESWKIKRNLTPHVTNSFIDGVYEAGLEAGALGGKLLGAGGGGFILFFVKPELRQNMREKLGALSYVPFAFENSGSQIVYYSPSNNY